MKLYRESANGIEGLLALAAKPPGTVMLVSDIAAAGGFPRVFLPKFFRSLSGMGWSVLSGGAIRGYVLARRPKEIKMNEILLAIEGPDLFERSIFWSDRCKEINPCPLHDQRKQLKHKFIEGLMEQTTLADLRRRTPVGSGVVKRPFVHGTGRRG